MLIVDIKVHYFDELIIRWVSTLSDWSKLDILFAVYTIKTLLKLEEFDRHSIIRRIKEDPA